MHTQPIRSRAWLAACLLLSACQRQEDALPLPIAIVEKLEPSNTRDLSIENLGDQTLHVWITDTYGDSHRHALILGDVPRQQALELLQRKQAVLHKLPQVTKKRRSDQRTAASPNQRKKQNTFF